MKIQSVLAAAALTLGASSVLAQEEEEGGQRPRPQMAMPIMAALDANKDGTLDAAEIANASQALLTLDKNGDGKLTPEELRPQGRGPRGPGGAGPGPRPGQNREGGPRPRR